MARNSGEGCSGIVETATVELFTPTTSDLDKVTREDKPVEPRELAVEQGTKYAASWMLEVLHNILLQN